MVTLRAIPPSSQATISSTEAVSRCRYPRRSSPMSRSRATSKTFHQPATVTKLSTSTATTSPPTTTATTTRQKPTYNGPSSARKTSTQLARCASDSALPSTRSTIPKRWGLTRRRRIEYTIQDLVADAVESILRRRRFHSAAQRSQLSLSDSDIIKQIYYEHPHIDMCFGPEWVETVPLALLHQANAMIMSQSTDSSNGNMEWEKRGGDEGNVDEEGDDLACLSDSEAITCTSLELLAQVANLREKLERASRHCGSEKRLKVEKVDSPQRSEGDKTKNLLSARLQCSTTAECHAEQLMNKFQQWGAKTMLWSRQQIR